ncbi:hypothetical protein LTR28_013908, partial [Elasticomyces elasticus]
MNSKKQQAYHEQEEEQDFDEDEDEFGLPSIDSMRWKSKRQPNKKVKDPDGTLNFARNGSSVSQLPSWTINNGDIAEERGVPQYPTAKKTEGKILRPQYKEILRDPANSLHLIDHPP